MATLFSCPRCTQTLPASASFCRHCGAAMDAPRRIPVTVPQQTPRHFLSAFLATTLVAALMLGGLVVFRVHTQISPVQIDPAQISPRQIGPRQIGPATYSPSDPPVYPRNPVAFPAYPQVVVPVFPNERDWREHHRDNQSR